MEQKFIELEKHLISLRSCRSDKSIYLRIKLIEELNRQIKDVFMHTYLES